MKYSYNRLKNAVKNNNIIYTEYDIKTDLMSVSLNDKVILKAYLNEFHSGIKNFNDLPDFNNHKELVNIIELYCLKLGKQVMIKEI